MRKLKRITAVLLAGVLALSMLAGCAQSGYTQSGEVEYGEFLMDSVRWHMSSVCLDGQEYENDPDLEKELQKWIEASVDPETNEIKSEKNGVIVYTPNQENPTKMSYYKFVMAYNPETKKTGAWDFNYYRSNNLTNSIGSLTSEYGAEYDHGKAFNGKQEKSAVAYKVLKDKEGNEHLYFAYGFVMTPEAS